MSKIKLLNLKSFEVITTPYFMKNFFAQHHHIEIGRFLSIPENLKIFNLLRKIIVALKLIKNISFKFSEPRQNKIIILDKESKFLL